ncbi:NTP transferase domain-containing protein, partial [Sphingomonas sp. 10B4]|nr:NTP transferase domain-containing protein [Sphingomonas sp. 10B4]
ASICVIYGHGGEQVLSRVAADDLRFAKQEPQLGTGHAVAQALPLLDLSMPTMILYGDVPLTSAATLRRLMAVAGEDKLAILTAHMADPTG